MTNDNSAEGRVRGALERPDRALLAEIRKHHWTGHNIPLTGSESTISRDIPLISDDARTQTLKSIVRGLFPPSRPLRIIDLGSLEGGLAFELAREGWDVTGIEGRESNYEKADLIRSYFALDNLRFELRDVKTLDPAQDGMFDVVVCCGLLYHLDNPFAFLETLAALTAPDGLFFLDTHIAPEHPEKLAANAAQLGEVETVEHGSRTYDGRWAFEPREGNRLDRQWSAVSNDRSFWPSRRSLIRGVYHAGFHSIMELFGMWEIDREFGLRDEFSRLYLACRRAW